MPKYANSTGTVISFGTGIRVEPYSSVESIEWIAESSLPIGITMSSETPFFDQIVSSVELTSTATVQVPINLTGNYKITVLADTGVVGIQLNSSIAGMYYLGEGHTKEYTCFSRIIDNLIITIAGSGKGYVTIEHI
jgi:hypothetical protein